MSGFTIYPAIDIRGGKCVRLIQGDYEQETVYGDSPFEMAARFAQDGARWIHMVDLDGAKQGKRINHEQVIKAAKELQVSVQIGGGIRSEEDVAYYLENGVARVILGSAAISDPAFVRAMLNTYGSQIAIGIDARDGFAATEGWLSTSTVRAEELASQLAESGAETFIYTDISKDGMLSGPNKEEIGNLAQTTQKNVIASGGISSLQDLEALRTDHRGIGGAIVGKALYTGVFTLKEALKKVK